MSSNFGGLSHLKCLADALPEEKADRHHMLPVMMTVKFAPKGLTVGDMLADGNVRKLWDNLRSNRHGSCSVDEWCMHHDAAVAILQACSKDMPVAMHCEVQMLLLQIAEIRHKMHVQPFPL